VNDETERWLEPLLVAALNAGADTTKIIRQATTPGAEAMSPNADSMTSVAPEGVKVRAIDWIRFGSLLRQHLEWTDYPEAPK
jgi:hypothetical protein